MHDLTLTLSWSGEGKRLERGAKPLSLISLLPLPLKGRGFLGWGTPPYQVRSKPFRENLQCEPQTPAGRILHFVVTQWNQDELPQDESCTS
jgi:hypothetical protein